LRNSNPQSPLHETWQNVLAGNPLADPTRLNQDPARPNLAHEYATVKDLFLQKGEAPAFIRALDQGGVSMHGQQTRDGRGFVDDGLYAAGNNFVVWDRNGVGHAYTNGAWSDVNRGNLGRTQNADGTVDMYVNRGGTHVPLLHADPNAQRPQRAEAPVEPGRIQGQAAALQDGSVDRAQPQVALAAPVPERGDGPMLQAPQKQKEMEMTPAERELFARAMNLVQNKAGMTEEDAKKVATDVIITTRTTPGLSEKPEYMDVRNGHVMIAERVGKEPIFNGYVNVEQSRGQTAEQVQDKVAVQNQQREQQTRQQIDHDGVSNIERKGAIARVDDEISSRVMSSMPALKI
jgi:hypothetical protein